MSTVKSKKIQLGVDATTSNNFTIYQPDSPDGSLKIGNGNADSPTEVLSINSSGVINNGIINDEDWHNIGETGEIAFQNGWSAYTGNADYSVARYKKINGVVHIEGLVSGGSAGNAVICTLPTGYRPVKNIFTASVSNNAFCRLEIKQNGELYANTGGSTTWISICFNFVASL